MMPRGIPNKLKEEKTQTATNNYVPVPPVIAKEQPIEAKEKAQTKPVLEPLQPGQKYFEAPDGDIIIGEDTKSQIWHRKLNGGRGGWVNPKR
jgi:hypothetical protein